ncbi:MAG TPA: TIGR02391 family protein [Streptosporangiaceae bacterium]|nr:TIGR02391 family protein [Streptosporangiaceae bacterium]
MPGTNGELLDLDLPLEMLHPVVRQAARPQWKARRFRAAVSDASTAVNDFAQRRLGRHDISGKDLMAQAFSTVQPPRALATPDRHEEPHLRRSRLKLKRRTLLQQPNHCRHYRIG